MVTNRADDGQNDGWKNNVLKEVKKPGKEVTRITTGKIGNVEDTSTCPSVNFNGRKDNKNSQNNGRNNQKY